MKKLVIRCIGILILMVAITGCGLLKKGCNCPKAKTSFLFYPDSKLNNDHLYCA